MDPLSAMLKAGFEAFDAIATVPLALPGDCGAKVTVRDALCPGARVSGRLRPVVLKPGPEAVTWVTVRLVPPVLLSVSERDWLVPVCTVPKAMLECATLSAAAVGFGVDCKVLLVLSPWQPSMVATASTTTSAFQRAQRFSIGNLIISFVGTAPEI